MMKFLTPAASFLLSTLALAACDPAKGSEVSGGETEGKREHVEKPTQSWWVNSENNVVVLGDTIHFNPKYPEGH